MSQEQEITIGEKLKNYRLTNCLSQDRLAETSGISIRTIQRIEEGKSVGSGYTLNALAKALNINSSDLINSTTQNSVPVSHNTNKLKILNLSAIAILLIPLANIVLPAYIYWKNRDDEKVKEMGSKIISFQILWTLCTLLMTLIIPAILLLLLPLLNGVSIPLFVPVYFVSAILNVYFIIRFAININQQLPFLERIPNIL
jgi:XRE family transcriptional regulator, regulator of sulfur utilization